MRFANKKLQLVSAAAAFALSWIGSAAVFAQADFYKGKTITIYIGTTPGALYDQWGRIIASHMVKHIPGRPNVIVYAGRGS
jgi:tripartite-type tricarboxylate transporter receptor subunit TctC